VPIVYCPDVTSVDVADVDTPATKGAKDEFIVTPAGKNTEG
jgi:hypothetical protein